MYGNNPTKIHISRLHEEKEITEILFVLPLKRYNYLPPFRVLLNNGTDKILIRLFKNDLNEKNK